MLASIKASIFCWWALMSSQVVLFKLYYDFWLLSPFDFLFIVLILTSILVSISSWLVLISALISSWLAFSSAIHSSRCALFQPASIPTFVSFSQYGHTTVKCSLHSDTINKINPTFDTSCHVLVTVH
jgi:hypothetical protein